MYRTLDDFSVIINYCSNESCFIHAILQECQKFTNEIIVSYGSHLYDGTPEDTDHIDKLRFTYPTVTFVEYNVNPNLSPSEMKGITHRPSAYWHNVARLTAVNALKDRNRWVFVLDADEIPEGDHVRKWLVVMHNMVGAFAQNECYKLATYWYFKDPTNQAMTLEDSILLIHASHLTENNIMGDFERDHLIAASKTLLKRQVRGLEGKVLFHHFSWCRPRVALEHKIRHWGHNHEYDADTVIREIYKNDDVNDIIHRYKYTKVPNEFNLKMDA